jgi:hypothetical protein
MPEKRGVAKKAGSGRKAGSGKKEVAAKKSPAKKSPSKKSPSKKSPAKTAAGKGGKSSPASVNPFQGLWDSRLFPLGTIQTCREPGGDDDTTFFVRGITATHSAVRHGRRPDVENPSTNTPDFINIRRPGNLQGDPDITYKGTRKDNFPVDGQSRICGTYKIELSVHGSGTLDETGDWMATRPPSSGALLSRVEKKEGGAKK